MKATKAPDLLVTPCMAVTILSQCFATTSTGLEPGKTAQTNPVKLYAFNRYMNFVGNVSGRRDITTTMSGTSRYRTGKTSIWSLGSAPTMRRAIRWSGHTVLRWGNYDTASGASRFVASEVPSSLGQYPNPVPSTQVLPASFYLSGKPSWWGSAAPWPAIGPDVTGGAVANVGGHVHKIPAQLCYELTSKTGGILNFDAANCYTSGGAGSAPDGSDEPENRNLSS